MAYESLLAEKKIKAYRAQPSEIQQLLHLAARDLAAATRNLPEDPEWAYSMSYNAVLQSGRAWMFYQGYRPRGAENHAVVVEFVRESFGNRYTNEVALFDQMRRKRNRVIYETTGLVSTNEAKQILKFAQKWVQIIESEITGQNRLPKVE